MKLSCITAVYKAINSGNRESLIRCVESVAKLQTVHEHLIYDGASTDGTVELLRELEAKTPCLKVVSEPDTGIYNALNKGVRDAQGEWLYVLGCDDYICVPDVLDGLLTEGGEDVIVAPVRRSGKDEFFQNISDLRNVLWWTTYSHQGMIMRTSRLRDFGGFDESYRIAGDLDLMLKAHRSGLHFRYTFQPFTFFTEGGTSDTQRSRADRERDLVFSEHFGVGVDEIAHCRMQGCQPLRCVVPFLFHRDMALRMSARYMVWLWIKHCFRPFLPKR